MNLVSDHMKDKYRLMEMLNDTGTTMFNFDYLASSDYRISTESDEICRYCWIKSYYR